MNIYKQSPSAMLNGVSTMLDLLGIHFVSKKYTQTFSKPLQRPFNTEKTAAINLRIRELKLTANINPIKNMTPK